MVAVSARVRQIALDQAKLRIGSGLLQEAPLTGGKISS